ncbi:MAG: hypothetical protein PHS14_06005 [Elusimicrobia bacterium]|nr:hypothetical protein [Elusimicrobiota bacterium]
MSLFVENLTAASVPAALSALREHGSSRLWAIDASRAGLFLARAACRPAPVEKLPFRMIDVRGEDGLLLRLRLSGKDSREILADLVKDPAFAAAAAGEGRLGAYLEKSAIVAGGDGGLDLWKAMYLIGVARWHARKAGEDRPVLLLERRPFFAVIRRYAERQGVVVIAGPRAVSAARLLRRWISGPARERLRLLQAHGLNALSARAQDDTPAAGPLLAAEFYGQLNLDKKDQLSNLFFVQQSSLPRRDVLVLFGLTNDPLDRARLEEVRRHGMEALAIHPMATADASLPLFMPREAPPRLSMALPEAGPERRWLIDRGREYLRRRSFWSELCRRRGIRLFVSGYSFDETHCAVADGVQDAGGVTAIYQRAYQALSTPGLRVDADVQFLFSLRNAALSAEDGSRVPYAVVTGYVSGHMVEACRPAAAALRARLEAAGAKKIVALFDENSIDDDRWHTGHELQRSNYRLLLEKVLEHPWLGVVAKPKAPRTLRRRLAPLADLLSRAEATGRFILLDAGPLYSAVPPTAAALAADIVAHGHLCAGTAAVESALAGVPTLLVDQEGWTVSPLHRLGPKVVFPDWESLWSSLHEHFTRPGGIDGLGDWSKLLPEIDPYRDGGGARRVGQFLDWTLAGFREGLARDAALARAAEKFAAAWGADKVTAISGRKP